MDYRRSVLPIVRLPETIKRKIQSLIIKNQKTYIDVWVS